MQTAANRASGVGFYEGVINQKNLRLVGELCTTTHVYHNPPTTLHGREEFKQLLSLYTTAFPDARLSVEDQLAEGDQVVIRYTFRGTHQADLIGIPPTGKQVTVTGMIITRIVNGTFEEGWLNFDALGMLQQLGVIPTMG